MKTLKELLMFSQTTIRNIGLFTSISLALLGVSRFYRTKIKIYDIGYLILSLSFIISSLIIAYYLIQDLEFSKKKIDDGERVDKWIVFVKGVACINFVILLFTLMSIYRQLNA